MEGDVQRIVISCIWGFFSNNMSHMCKDNAFKEFYLDADNFEKAEKKRGDCSLIFS